MTPYQYYMIKGYITMLETQVPNGRYVHQIANKVTALKLCLSLMVPMPPDYEKEVKSLIKKLRGEHVRCNTDD